MCVAVVTKMFAEYQATLNTKCITMCYIIRKHLLLGYISIVQLRIKTSKFINWSALSFSFTRLDTQIFCSSQYPFTPHQIKLLDVFWKTWFFFNAFAFIWKHFFLFLLANSNGYVCMYILYMRVPRTRMIGEWCGFYFIMPPLI